LFFALYVKVVVKTSSITEPSVISFSAVVEKAKCKVVSPVVLPDLAGIVIAT
jgi:hypothetical protein